MNVLKAFYHHGIIDLIEKPSRQQSTSVLVVFPEEKTEVRSLRGAVKLSKPIDYSMVESDLRALANDSLKHIAEEFADE